LSDALAVSFDSHIGHDYLDDADERFEFYHRIEEKVAFDLEMFNLITKGGLSKKTLNIALAGTGVGKSLFMCHVSASTLMQGKNVLYITMEMAEERIAERIDANLLNLTMDELKVIDKDIFDSRMEKLSKKTQGKLIVKEYPTASAHAGHFRALLEELKMKRDFRPDIIMIDYLNICSSQRVKQGGSVNSYTYIKSIAEELRGLAVEYNVPILSATQTTRSGFTNSDPGLEDTSESFGLPATADFMFALVSNEELEQLNQIIVKQLKNRYNDPGFYKRFVVGIDRSKMKLYDVEASAQQNLSDAGQSYSMKEDKPLFDQSEFGKRLHSSTGFSDFKF
jgi:replicative DNA helicase